MKVKSFKEIVDELKCLEEDVVFLPEETFEVFLRSRVEHKKGENPKLKEILEKAKKIEENNLK